VGESEAVGDSVTGVVGRVIEPKAGETSDGHTHETNCLNCGAALAGPFCHECGQHARIQRTLHAFFYDFLHGVLHFEGKIWRTLPLLAWKPGELTRRYIDGQRAQFVSPIALYLFTVFLMFAAVGVTGGFETPTGAGVISNVEEEIADARANLTELEIDRAKALRERRPTGEIDSKLTDARAELTALQSLNVGKVASATQVDDDGEASQLPFWARGMIRKSSKNPELLAYKVKTNAYKFSWALIPISVPFIWLLFPFSRRFRAYDHTVFVTYSLCFMMLLLVVGSTIQFVSSTIASLLFFIPPFHMYRQLKGTYGLSRWGALWRTTLLVGFAFAAIGMFAALIVSVGEV
jgi:hypothetical protein